MKTKTITFELGVESINDAIKELRAYSAELKDKTEQLRNRIAQEIYWSAENGFSVAIADDIYIGGDERMADVSVTIGDEGDVVVVMAHGTDAVFVEFGAGVYHNAYAYSSPHPKGEEHGFLIGTYGQGQGVRNSWHLPDSTRGNPIVSHGTPAQMPMYKGVQEAVSRIKSLAREVFG